MNEKAASLGCKNTHFANPHGLNNSNHKTTAYDMCLIMRAAVQNETFRKIDTTRTYDFPALKNAAARTITMGHKMMYPSDSRYYEGIIGGKTGYTSLAGNTLVTAAERNGVRLIAVVLKSSGTHYTDTKAMLDYGFENYEALTGRSASAVTSGDTAASTGNSSAVSGSGSVTVVAGSSSQNVVGPANDSTATTVEAGNASTGETTGAAAAETTASSETSQASSPSGNAVLSAPSSSSGQSSELPTTVLTPVQ
jgi:D-alanyl-D-alanine carboxypeptidase